MKLHWSQYVQMYSTWNNYRGEFINYLGTFLEFTWIRCYNLISPSITNLVRTRFWSRLSRSQNLILYFIPANKTSSLRDSEWNLFSAHKQE